MANCNLKSSSSPAWSSNKGNPTKSPNLLQLCNHFNKGSCRFGDRCKYVHDYRNRSGLYHKSNNNAPSLRASGQQSSNQRNSVWVQSAHYTNRMATPPLHYSRPAQHGLVHLSQPTTQQAHHHQQSTPQVHYTLTPRDPTWHMDTGKQDMEKHPHESTYTVFNCVIPYIHNRDDRNVVSLVCRKWYEIDGMTRKHLTVHVCSYLEPSRVAQRFPYLESLTLKGFPLSFQNVQYTDIKPWIKEIVASFECLKALDIRRVTVHDSDLKLLARSRGKDLRVLKINNCKGFKGNGLMHIARHCNDLRTLCFEDDKKNLKIWKWLHELALNNTLIESFKFSSAVSEYGVKVLTLLAKNCSQSLVSLKMGKCNLSDLREVFNHAVNLKDFACCGFEKVLQEGPYVGFNFPPNMRCICTNSIYHQNGLPLILPLSNQQPRELKLKHLNEDKQCSLIRKCPNLEGLYISDMFGDSVLQVIGNSCKKLRKLHTDGLPVTHKGLIALAQGCLELECLHINSSEHISNESLKCIGSHLKRLNDFHITLQHRIDNVLDNGIKAMLIGCSKLKWLSIDPCGGQLTDVSLAYIGKYGHNLRYLSLGYIRDFEAGLVELSKGCPKLREMEIRNCVFNKQALSTLMSKIKSLRYIWVIDTEENTFLAKTRYEWVIDCSDRTILAKTRRRKP